MFPNWFFDSDNCLATLGGTPEFRRFSLQDHNPLSGRTKWRQISAPNNAMRRLHQRLITYLRSLPIALHYATACRPRCSARLGLERHLGRRHFYLTDISSAYGQVEASKLATVICAFDPALLGQSLFPELAVETVRRFLCAYCCHPDGRGLIVGAPASPELFNLYAAVLLDSVLGPLCARYQLSYTRYMDDLVFSAYEPIGEKKRHALRAVIEQAGLPIAHHKSEVRDLHKGPLAINGYVLFRDGRVTTNACFRRRLRGLIHLAYGDPTGKLKRRVDGMMGVIRSARYARSRPWRAPRWSLSELQIFREWKALQEVTQRET